MLSFIKNRNIIPIVTGATDVISKSLLKNRVSEIRKKNKIVELIQN